MNLTSPYHDVVGDEPLPPFPSIDRLRVSNQLLVVACAAGALVLLAARWICDRAFAGLFETAGDLPLACRTFVASTDELVGVGIGLGCALFGLALTVYAVARGAQYLMRRHGDDSLALQFHGRDEVDHHRATLVAAAEAVGIDAREGAPPWTVVAELDGNHDGAWPLGLWLVPLSVTTAAACAVVLAMYDGEPGMAIGAAGLVIAALPLTGRRRAAWVCSAAGTAVYLAAASLLFALDGGGWGLRHLLVPLVAGVAVYRLLARMDQARRRRFLLAGEGRCGLVTLRTDAAPVVRWLSTTERWDVTASPAGWLLDVPTVDGQGSVTVQVMALSEIAALAQRYDEVGLPAELPAPAPSSSRLWNELPAVLAALAVLVLLFGYTYGEMLVLHVYAGCGCGPSQLARCFKAPTDIDPVERTLLAAAMFPQSTLARAKLADEAALDGRWDLAWRSAVAARLEATPVSKADGLLVRLERDGTIEFCRRASAIEAGAARAAVPAGLPGQARHVAAIKAIRALYGEIRPRCPDQSVMTAYFVRRLSKTRLCSPRPLPAADRLLAEIFAGGLYPTPHAATLGIGWCGEWAVSAEVRQAWIGRGLDLVDRLDRTGAAAELRPLRARLLAAAGRHAEAAALYALSRRPEDALRLVSSADFAGWPLDRLVAILAPLYRGPEPQATEARMLEAVVRARHGQLQQARELLRGVPAEPAERRVRAELLDALLCDQVDVPGPAADDVWHRALLTNDWDGIDELRWGDWLAPADLWYLESLVSWPNWKLLGGLDWYPYAARCRAMAAAYDAAY